MRMCIENIAEKMENFQDELVSMENVDGMRNVMPYLGTVDAVKEWNDNPKTAYSCFLHTESFRQFSNENMLILLGRTGTGKTAILKCLCESVNKKLDSSTVGNQYDMAVMVPFNEILANLVNTSDDISSPVINDELEKIMSMYINCYVMKTLIEKEGLSNGSKMYQYILNNHLYDLDETAYLNSGINKIQVMLRMVAGQERKLGTASNNVIALAGIINAFMENGYEDAYAEMAQHLENKKILVLVDTLDEYNLREAKVVLSVKALIATCFKYYNTSGRRHIYVKISIPSEIHTILLEQLPGKQQGNTVVIQWKFKDLIKMIAIRLLNFCKNDGSELWNIASGYSIEDFYDNNSNAAENARKFLHEILPEACPSSLDYTLDTLGYCVRHTLKKPRELMTIFNYFIDRIIEEKNTKFFIQNPDEIRNSIHTTQEETISAALSMYTSTYNGIMDVCGIILQNRKFYFQGKDLDDSIKEAAVGRDYDGTDIRRILLESGLVGKVNSIRTMGEETAIGLIDRSNAVRVIRAKFEYQVKGRLSLNRDDYYVIHPMCYEHFECKLGRRTLVYPDEFNDDVEIMKSVRLKK